MRSRPTLTGRQRHAAAATPFRNWPAQRKAAWADIARRIAEAAAAAGGRALVVGGWVRDRLRGHPSKDIDIEVFGIAHEQLPALLSQFGRVEPVGQSFPVYKIGTIDVGLPTPVITERVENEPVGVSHSGFPIATGYHESSFPSL